MSDTLTRLPGLIGKTVAELKELHLTETGTAPGDELDTAPKLIKAIKAHRQEADDDTPATDTADPKDAQIAALQAQLAAATGTPAVANGVTKYSSATGLPHTLPATTWALLPEAYAAEFTDQPVKPGALIK